MKVIFEVNKKCRWIDTLADIIKEYNNSMYRMIGMKPIEVDKGNEKALLETVFKYVSLDSISQSLKLATQFGF